MVKESIIRGKWLVVGVQGPRSEDQSFNVIDFERLLYKSRHAMCGA